MRQQVGSGHQRLVLPFRAGMLREAENGPRCDPNRRFSKELRVVGAVDSG